MFICGGSWRTDGVWLSEGKTIFLVEDSESTEYISAFVEYMGCKNKNLILKKVATYMERYDIHA